MVRRAEAEHLHDVDLDRDAPFGYCTDHHQERTREFLDGLLTQVDAAALRKRVDRGRTGFVDRLRVDQ